MKRFSLALIILIASLSAAIAEDKPPTKKITLSVKETITATADRASLIFSIEAEDENATDAEKAQRRKQENLFKALDLPIAADIAEIKTASIILGPMSITKSAIPTIIISQECTIVVQNKQIRNLIKRITEFLDIVTDHVKIDSIFIKYEMNHPEELKNRAYDSALTTAKRQAQLIADKFNKKLGDPILIGDTYTDLTPSTPPARAPVLNTDVKMGVELYLEFELN
jgi:uncharacterized protein YggE